MKTKEEILKMTAKELESYKWSDDLDGVIDNNECTDCIDCSYCFFSDNCNECTDCIDCSYCFFSDNCNECTDCTNCDYCTNCTNCDYCTACDYSYKCRNAKGLRYAICNVELSKEEYDKKLKELGVRI